MAAAAAITWAVFTMIVLHVVSAHDPLRDTLSSYAFTDRGTGMLAGGILAVAGGSLAVLAALRSAGIVVGGRARLLFGTWSLGLTTAALFPASYPDHPNPVSGEIHQYSCLTAFLSLPALGFSLLERIPELRNRTMVRRLAVGATVALVLFGVSYALPWLVPVGLTQRAALIVDVALLCSLLVVVRARIQATSGAAREATVRY